jgi:hypothetical protein
MCDYSLERVASRAALKGDRLITTQFAQSLTRGFATESDPNTAVCLLPGTELVFECAPQWLFWSKKAPSPAARFRQINLNNRHCHHDSSRVCRRDARASEQTERRPASYRITAAQNRQWCGNGRCPRYDNRAN